MLKLLFTLLLSATMLVSADDAGLEWQGEYAAAFELAKEKDTIVFLAVNMDGERANDNAAKKLYKNKVITELAEGTVNLVASKFVHSKSGACPRLGGVTCEQHQRVDIKARGAIFNPDGDAEVIAPHHVFLDKEGTVLLSVPYEVRAEELAWCFTTALRLAYPEGEFAFTKGARAPKRVVMGDVTKGAGADTIRPLTEDELEETLKALQATINFGERARLVYSLIATDHPDAIEAVERELITASIGGGRSGRGLGGLGGGLDRLNEAKRTLIHRMGIYSPSSYWEALVPQLSGDDEGVRLESAVALEQMAVPESLKELRKTFKKEESDAVRRAMVRAMGTAGAGDSGTRKALSSLAKSDKDQPLQLNAIFGLGNQGADKSVRKLFEAAIAEKKSGPTQALVLGIAFARNETLIDLLVGFGAEQGDWSKEIWECVEAARAVFDGGNLSGLREHIQRVCGDTVERERFFGAVEKE
ncbi:MAG: HEAT repeat domain-containing protein [Planctomycetes bacterium]|nr:HEAT repeat domain-containing protein [Planctomycetota bacterium]MCP4771301.1 HEAT repeat domain-containing protein [Planctomycetota bacterium]MCP4860466.1 HEAT repeat domain-containing protein [Planctomycetota bacterium]